MITDADRIFEGNTYNRQVLVRVVRGVDADGDGIIDAVELVE